MKPFLRHQDIDNPERKQAYLKHAEDLQALPDDATTRFLELLYLLGSEALQLGLLDDAKNHLKNALQLARQTHKPLIELNSRLQLAIALQYLDDNEAADEQFQRALKMTMEIDLISLRDQILQAWGKFLAEQGKYDVAKTCFQEALKLRQAMQKPGLIEESEDALELLDALGLVNDEGYAVTYTEIAHIEVPEGAGPLLD